MYPPFPLHPHVPDSMHAGFFILRTHALWNNNRVVLAAMLFFFVVSPMPLRTHARDLMHDSGYHHSIHHSSIRQQCCCTMYICVPTLFIASHSQPHVHSLHQHSSGYHRLLPDLGHTAPRIVYTLVFAWTGCASQGQLCNT